jgi:hypothetical protein
MTNPATSVASTTITITPPGETEPTDIELNLFGFTIAERNLAKKALAQFTDPDLIEIVCVNAWVVWRRTHPDVKLDDWVNGITFGDLLGVSFEDLRQQPFDTPEGFDPEA